jgi:AcrR family transcriptional regulator
MVVRGSTDRGAATRTRIREAAASLFVDHLPDQVTVSGIASAAGVYPNQITHHFGSKDALFVLSAFTLLLRDAERLEGAGARMTTARAFRAAVARTVLAAPSIPIVVHALAVARDRPELAPLVERNLTVLFRQSERFLERTLQHHGWRIDRTPGQEVKTFWSAVLGATLISRAGFPGGADALDLPGTLTVREADRSG